MNPDPYRAYNFNLLIEGLTVGGFLEVSGPAADVDVIAYREGGAGSRIRHLPGQVSYTPLVLRYGVTRERTLWDWFESTEAGVVERRNVSLVQYDNDGSSEAFRWNLYAAWPSRFVVAPLDGALNEIAIESVTLVYDRLERD